MNFFKGLVSSNATMIPDTMKLVVIGGTVETARRITSSAWNGFVDSFFLNAHFSSQDYPYDWLLHWLSKQPAWGRSREFEITTRSRNGRWSTPTTGDLEEDEEDGEELVHGRRKRRVAFMPSVDTTHTVFFKGHWLRITRSKRQSDYGHCDELKVSVVARNNNIIKQLVLEAKRDYERDAEHRVHIFLADTYGSWRWTGSKQKRPLSSIVLEPSVKDMLLSDCRDFLCSEDWYAERGIPYRRGYLLHGVPGSGKTSLIHSLAGELGLDIYVVSLSSKGMSDNTLATLMSNVPSRCILLLEDLDAAFTRGVTRDSSSTGTPTSSTKSSTSSSSSSSADDGSTLSLSGLLNALDGVAAAEGRILFATTNHIDRLDPALSRPGRCDVWVNFTNASKWQAEGLYKCFFPSAVDATEVPLPAEETPISQKNIPVPRRKKLDIVRLPASEIEVLAKRFAESIPENEFSVASIQGFLLQNKTRPRECVDETAAWVIKERETKAKLKKEKEEKEAQEKKEAEEKAKKEKEEKEKEAKSEKAKEKKEEAAKKEEAKTEEKPSESTEDTTATSSSATKTESPSSTAEAASSTTAVSSPDPDVEDSEAAGSASASVSQTGSDGKASESKSEKWVAVKNEDASTTTTTSPATSS